MIKEQTIPGALRKFPYQPNFRVVMVEPEIPQNTGNVGRTCVGSCSELHLVGPLGFSITDSQLKRAGLDYWPHLSWLYHENQADFEKYRTRLAAPSRSFYFSARAERPFWDADFQLGDWLFFGKETKGLGDELLRQNSDRVFQIPILGPVRSFNVATAAAMVLFEGLRQLNERGEMLRDPGQV